MSTKSNQSNEMTKENILDFIKRYQEDTDNEELQSYLVSYYDQLVASLSRKFAKNKGIEEDLYQVGMIGLLGALRRFDTSMGRSFESFAVPTIVGEIKRYMRDKTWSIHVPRRIKELGPKIKQAVEQLTNDKQRSPSVQEIAAYLEVTEEEILETMEMGKSYQAASVDSQMDADQEGGTVTLLDLVGQTDKGYQNTNERLMLEKAFTVLSDLEKEVINCTYFDHLSQKEAGEAIGISQMHVSRLQRRALRKLRESLADEGMTSTHV